MWHDREQSFAGGKITHEMQLSEKNARKWNVLALSILALAIAVFAWGLRYKVSLYESAPPSAHHVIAVRLLSNRERSPDIAQQVERATAPLLAAVCVAFAMFAGLFFDPKPQSRWVMQRAQNSQRRPIPLASQQIFFRPPPPRIR